MGSNGSALVNQSQHNNSSMSSYSDAQMVLLGAAMAILIMAIVFGNILVITAMLRFRRLQTVTNLFIGSLAAADLIMGVVVVPFGSSKVLASRWQFGNPMCAFWTATDVLCVTASIGTLCVIALDRYLAITSPLRYPVLLTRCRAFAVILVVWAVASLVSYPPILLEWSVSDDNDTMTCLKEPACCEFNTNITYAVSSSIVSFYLPLVVMIFLYAQVFKEAQKQLEKIRGRERHFCNLHYTAQLAYPDDSPAMNKLRAGTEVGEHTGEDRLNMQKAGGMDTGKDEKGGENRARTEKGEGKHSKKRQKFCLKEHKAIKTLGIIIGTFILCWLPFFILNILIHFFEGLDLPFSILNWIGYSNSAFNPLIYCRTPEFRHAFQEILCLRGKVGGWGGRRGWGWCRERDCYSKPPVGTNVDSDLTGVGRLTSGWEGSLESSARGSPLTLAPLTSSSHCEQVLEVAPGSLTNWQANSSANGSCKENVASIV